MTRGIRVSVAIFFALLSLSSGHALAADDGTSMKFTAEPLLGSSASDDGYFKIKTQPGDELKRAIAVKNTSDAPVVLSLSSVAALTGSRGGVDYGLPEDDHVVGEWIDLSARRIELQPHEDRRVPFTVSVPTDAPGGVSLGGIAVWIPEVGPKASSKKSESDAVITVQTRRVIAVQLNLPDGAAPSLDVDEVKAIALPDGPYLEMRLLNTGSTLTDGTGTISVPDLDYFQKFTFDTFVPGTKMDYPVKLAEMPSTGTFPATIHANFKGGNLEWSGNIVVGDALADELVDRGAIEAGFPMVRLILIALGFVLAGGLLLLIRRRGWRPRLRRIAVPIGVSEKVLVSAPPAFVERTMAQRRDPPPPPPARAS